MKINVVRGEKELQPNPLGAALTVYTVIFSFFSLCSLVSLTMGMFAR